MDYSNRPLSPHLQVYKPQLTSVLSILHRISGVVLSLGAVLIALWLNLLAYDREMLETVYALLGTVIGRIFLFAWTLTLFYHLCNGIRHLFWDAGKGFELHQVNRSGWMVLASTLILTLIVWGVGYAACA